MLVLVAWRIINRAHPVAISYRIAWWCCVVHLSDVLCGSLLYSWFIRLSSFLFYLS